MDICIMRNYIILLRGVNVSGKNILKMDLLKKSLKQNGFTNLKTYIQSGNIILQALQCKTEIKKSIEILLLNEFQISTQVFVYSAKELETTFVETPFPKDDLKKLYFTFLEKQPSAENIQNLSSYITETDKFKCNRTTLYLYCGNGYGKTKLTNNFIENKLDVNATTRNYNTIRKLIEMSK